MIFKELDISSVVIQYFTTNQNQFQELEICNRILENKCGINTFFDNSDQLNHFNTLLSKKINIVEESNRKEYGDFQTNLELTLKSVEYIKAISNSDSFDFILEPTCGKGNFIIAALTMFTGIMRIVGLEIYQPYVWETKFRILKYFLENENCIIPRIDIVHANVFEYDFIRLSKETKEFRTLVIGNPPWVTNSELSSIGSQNLPVKSNFKNHSGLDAITGKGNFDIGEYISMIMLNHFSKHQGYFGFIIKNSVVKNLLYEQKNNNFSISDLKKLTIDAKKEFNVSVDASFFVARLNQKSELLCKSIDFYSLQEMRVFGWVENYFVNSVEDYKQSNNIDGTSQFTWRQGIKHDCSKIMEIEKYNGNYMNGLRQELNIEKDLVYGLLKSSDLKKTQTNSYRKLIIVTQKKIGQDTDYIKWNYPLTYYYLNKNGEYFDRRKSSIYRGKPRFSIFGVGAYSFKPYKVAISGMYKSTHFTLVTPDNGKPLMLDDTCYFIGFEEKRFAKIALYLLNHEHTQQFLKAIIFPDSKRSITKEILMRIDFGKIYKLIDYSTIINELDVSLNDWSDFGKILMSTTDNNQMSLF